MARRRGKRRSINDPILQQMADGVAEATERTIGTAAALFSADTVWREYDDEYMLYYNPIADPVNFLRRPFGTSLRMQITYHLSKAADHIAGALELCRGKEWLLTPEDAKFLDETFWRLNRVHPRKKE